MEEAVSLEDEVANQQPQHLTYGGRFVRELHAFIEARLADALVCSAMIPNNSCICALEAFRTSQPASQTEP